MKRREFLKASGASLAGTAAFTLSGLTILVPRVATVNINLSNRGQTTINYVEL